jgi:tetratricopeptide (TPR) repeat protein
MFSYNHFISKKILLLPLLLLLAVYFPGNRVHASSLSGAVKGLAVDQIKSPKEMKTALELLYSCCREAQEKNQFTFDLQKTILSKSGECISRIVELDQQAKKEETRSLFTTNRKVIKTVLSWNQEKVENLQETKLDQMEDTAAFFASSEWQQPHHVISLASYWLSWNGYYSALFYPAADPNRKDLLEGAIEGFSRSFIDFKEESIVVRSLFGRALAYKELQQYDQAIRDINAVIGKIKKDDALYQRCRYEKVLISYLTRNYQSVLRELDTFREETGRSSLSPTMDAELNKLRVKTIIALSEEEGQAQGKNPESLYRNALHELNKLVETDGKQAGELYRYANQHAAALADLSYDELGPIGYLAIADWYFNQKDYESAILRYQRLYASSSTLIKKRMDDVYFRLGYCFCQKNRWREALPCFESLFKQFPRSSFSDKSSCLYYVAAANNYRDTADDTAYATYMEATKRYVKHCTETGSKSEAHFQLGKYYQDRGKEQQAFEAFSLVKKDSPNYAEASYFLVQANIDKIESLNRRGKRQSKGAKKVYGETRKQLEEYQSLLLKQEKGPARKELEAHIALLQAKLYIYGPEGDYSKALDKLKKFEERFPVNRKLAMMAQGLRIECYQRLQMFKEAKGEINAFLKSAPLNSDQWTFLNEWANRFYEESKKLRSSGDTVQASQNAEIALMIYEHLSSFALQKTSYERFYDSMQLRIAEILRDENQVAQAITIYQKQLKRDPTSADAIYNLGLLQEQEEQWEEALATWRKFSEGFKTGSHYWFESRYHTAKVLNKLGKQDKACEITTMIEVLHPTLRDEQFREKFIVLHRDVCD